MRPTLFSKKNVKLLGYLGVTKNLEFSKVIQTRFIVSHQCSRDNNRETNDLINLYSKSEALGSARALMPDNGFAFENKVWDKATYIGIFGLSDLDLGRQAHNKLLKSGVETDESLCSAMINMYGKCGEISLARKVFDMFEPQNAVTLTAMSAAYLEHGSFGEPLKLFFDMMRDSPPVAPNESTVSVLLTASAKFFSNRSGKMIHALAEKIGLIKGHKNVEDALIDMYARTGDIKAAEKVFLGIPRYNRDIGTWNTMIHGYCHHGLGNESLALFQEMVGLGEDPNYDTFVGVLNACGQVGLVEQGFYYLKELMKEKGVEPGVDHYRCIINMLIRAGQLNEALNFIVSTPSKLDVFCWTSLLSGCHAHGNYTLGIRAAELIPDDVATEVSKSYGVTQVREVMELRDDIKEEHGPSWVEVKDLTYEFHPVYKGDKKYHEFMKFFLRFVKSYFDLLGVDVEDAMKRGDCDGYLSEEIAVGFVAMGPVFGTDEHGKAPICIIKNSGKISGRCHALMKLISQATGRVIMVKDAHFFHHFQRGRCSCADYW